MFKRSVSFVFRYPEISSKGIVSGEVKNAYHFTTELIKKSEQSLVISFEEDHENTSKEFADNTTIIRIKTPKSRGVIRYIYRIILGVKALVREDLSNIEIVHSHITYGSWVAYLLGMKKKLITTPHGTNFQEIKTELGFNLLDMLRYLNANLQRYLDSFIMNGSLLNVSVSRYQIADMQRSYKCKKSIKTIYNGVPSYYQPLTKSKQYDVLFVGRACQKKGLDIVLKLANTNTSTRFCMVLGDEIFTTLDDGFMLKLKRTENIDIKFDICELDLVEIFNKSSFLIVPSRGYESLPTVIMEAIACGVPVIATKAWGIPEVIINESLMFPEDNFTDIQKAISYVSIRGFQSTDYKPKFLNIEHQKLINYFKEIICE